MAHKPVKGGSAIQAEKMFNNVCNSAIRGARRMGRMRTAPAKHYVTYHSFRKHLLLCFVGIGILTIPLITLSPGHRWKK